MLERLIPIPNDRHADFDYVFQLRMQQRLIDLDINHHCHNTILKICLIHLDNIYYLGISLGADLRGVYLLDNQIYRALVQLELSPDQSRMIIENAITMSLDIIDSLSKNLPIETAPSLLAGITSGISYGFYYGFYGIYTLATYPFSFFRRTSPTEWPVAEATSKNPTQSL